MPLLSLSAFQLLLAFVSAGILHRLTYNNFSLKLLVKKQLVYYLPPTNDDLRALRDKKAGSNRKARRAKERRRQGASSNEVFKIPATDLVGLQLIGRLLTLPDITSIPFAADVEWILDLTLMSVFSFLITHLQFCMSPGTKEYNFSLLWAILIITYSIKVLFTFTLAFFKNQRTVGERSVTLVSGFILLLIASVMLLSQEKRIQFGLDKAYESFNEAAKLFLRNHTPLGDETSQSKKPASFLAIKVILIVFSALIGMVFTFPGIRIGQLSNILLDDSSATSFDRMLYGFNYMVPLLVCCLWVKPIVKQAFPNLDEESLGAYRVIFVIIVSLFRLYLVPRYLAAFLGSCKHRIQKLRRRGGISTNREIQLGVTSIFNYLNVVAIQYMLPTIMCLFTGIILLTMGCLKVPTISSDQYQNATLNTQMNDVSFSNHKIKLESGDSTSMITLIRLEELRRLFTPEVHRGILGYAIWWLHFSWFCTSTMGLIYHRYFFIS